MRTSPAPPGSSAAETKRLSRRAVLRLARCREPDRIEARRFLVTPAQAGGQGKRHASRPGFPLSREWRFKPHRPVAQPHRVLARQPGLQRRQGDVRVGHDVRRHGGFQLGRQLARPVTAARAGARLAGAPPTDQRLVDIRHADPENRRCRPRRHAAVNRRQNSRPQVLRIALSLPPSHRRAQYLAVGAANHTLPSLGIPFQRFHSIGHSPATVNT